MLKKLITCSAFALFLLQADAQQLKTPSPSTTQTLKQELGLGSVELSYARPNARGRKVFGDLVPYGSVWRTGANAATTLTFSDEVTIGGTKVPAGKYGLLSIPTPNEWTLILTKQTDVTSPAAYKPESDIVRVKATTMQIPMPMETFTMQFANVRSNSAELHIMWENTAVSLPILMDVDSKVMAQINNMMNKDNRPYFQSAMYYLETGKDLNQALAWFDKAVEQQPNAFWVHHQRANALAKLGRKDEARKTAMKSMDLARQAQNMDYVRLNEKLISDLK
jgi:tetratricopeptide (TPR) repeat protein